MTFLISYFDIFKNVLIYSVDNSSLVHNGNRKKYILFVDEGPAAALDDTTKIVEAKHVNNFTRSKKKFFYVCITTEVKTFLCSLFTNYVSLNPKVKSKTISIVFRCHFKCFTVDKLKQPEFNRYVYDFSVDDNSIKVTTTVKICKYLMKKKKNCLDYLNRYLLQY